MGGRWKLGANRALREENVEEIIIIVIAIIMMMVYVKCQLFVTSFFY